MQCLRFLAGYLQKHVLYLTFKADISLPCLPAKGIYNRCKPTQSSVNIHVLPFIQILLDYKVYNVKSVSFSKEIYKPLLCNIYPLCTQSRLTSSEEVFIPWNGNENFNAVFKLSQSFVWHIFIFEKLSLTLVISDLSRLHPMSQMRSSTQFFQAPKWFLIRTINIGLISVCVFLLLNNISHSAEWV